MSDETRKFDITGMSCAACSARVEKAVKGVEGVSSVQVNLLTNSMLTTGVASNESIIKAVVDAGYGAKLSNETSSAKILEDNESPRILKRFLISLIFLIPEMYLSMGVSMFDFPAPSIFDNPFVLWNTVALLTIIVLGINYKFFANGLKALAHLSPNMDSLVALGSGASFVYSFVWLFKFNISWPYVDRVMEYTDNFFFDSAAMILVLISIGKYLEARAKGKTTNAIKSLVALSPKSAVVIKDGIEVEIPASELKVEDTFVLKAGMSVPTDGIVIEGESSIDESMLTGESVLVKKMAGSEVHQGTVNGSGKILCKATKIGQDTTLSQIVKLVSDSAATKAPIARIADKVASIFVPVVMGIALVTFVVWMIAGYEIGFSLSRAISVLVISCPCALGLATPVTIMVANGVAAKNGILFKTSEALEKLGTMQIAALDKTGTITEGNVIDPTITTEGDSIRPDSKEAIYNLKGMGLKVYMLSGDKEEPAKAIGAEAGVDEVISSLKPDGKADEIKKLKLKGKVLMVGDGVNDAVALTIADSGMAIGAGTDVAINAAEVVLMKNNLTDAVAAIRLSRIAIKTIKENLFWAFCYNLVGIPLAAGALIPLFDISLTPMFGAACMSVSSILVVTNSLRINLKDIYNNKHDKKITNSTKEKKLMQKEIIIEGMMCGHCSDHVMKALEKLDSVEAADVDYHTGKAIVTLTAETSDDILKQTIEEEGYKVISIN